MSKYFSEKKIAENFFFYEKDNKKTEKQESKKEAVSA